MIPDEGYEDKISVMVVEDDMLVREGIKLMVERIGCTIVGEAADGIEAVYLSNTLEPDVILMDLGLPGLNGMAAARRCYGKVIILTGWNTAELVEEARSADVVTCLTKPVFPDDLKKAIFKAVSIQA